MTKTPNPLTLFLSPLGRGGRSFEYWVIGACLGFGILKLGFTFP
jgi:hypothetical protein